MASTSIATQTRTVTAARVGSLGFLNPVATVTSLARHRRLIWMLAKREIEQRYRGSILGFFWSFLTPLMTLAVYTFVFSVLFRSRWSASGSESRIDFAFITFCGLIAFTIFSESVNKAPGTIVFNVNYVKKVVFPVEVLPVASTIASLIQAAFSVLVLAAGFVVFRHPISWHVLLAPIIVIPIVFLALGFSLFLASLSVFLRDTGHVVAIVTSLLVFLSAVLYPVSALPAPLQPYVYLNPLIPMIENFRAVVVMGHGPDWRDVLVSFVISAIVFQLGYAWFMRTRRWFSDVL